jgi:glycosyltransferase involved in cell wall biosynthesis
MSCVYRGAVVDTDLSRNARGGTEMMRERLIAAVPSSLLDSFAIHFSRPRQMYDDVKNIFYAHDLAGDPENKILLDSGWKMFDKLVFVSYWQRDQYMMVYNIPYSKCTVIENAIETEFEYNPRPTNGPIRFIYHTTPHRGLELLYPVFDLLSKEFNNIHLDVFSSFEIYGWKERDARYKKLFDDLSNHSNITYHGTRSNEEVISTLKQSHIFLYPCIWQETSCIAMIEAIRCGCLVIHPGLAALPETASGMTVMYDFHENHTAHANIAYRYVKNILTLENKNSGFINTFASDSGREMNKNSITTYTTKWVSLLEQLKKQS